MQECLFPFGVAFALQKDSPYTNKFDLMLTRPSLTPCFSPRFSSKIQQLKEFGLVSQWIQQEQDKVAKRLKKGGWLQPLYVLKFLCQDLDRPINLLLSL